MKKIFNFIINLNKYFGWKPSLFVALIVFILMYLFGDNTIMYSTICALIYFILLYFVVGVSKWNEEKTNEIISNRYKDDPDWDEYKRLKDKFNGY